MRTDRRERVSATLSGMSGSAAVARWMIAIAIGCGGGSSPPDLHVLVACEPGAWPINGEEITMCELGCAAGPAEALDSNADGNVDDCTKETVPDPCPVAFYAEVGGVGGCCVPEIGTTIADSIQRFHACR